MRQREDWWEYTKRIIRSYPALERKANSTGPQAVTATYGPSGGRGNTPGKPVERAVVDRLSEKEQRRYDAVRDTIDDTEKLKTGERRIALIRMVYWDRSHTLYGAAMRLHISEATAYRWNNCFVRAVSKKLNLP